MSKICTRNPDFQLWPAGPEAAPLVLEFMKKLGVYQKMEAAVTATAAGLAELLKSGQGEAVFGDYRGKTVAFAWFYGNSSAFIGQSGIYIDAFYVDEEARGQGLGKIILAWLAKTAAERGCQRLEWNCLDWNTPAIQFYSRYGACCMDAMRTYRLSFQKLREMAENL